MRSYFRLILIAQLLISGSLAAYSQTPEELRKQADLLFEQGRFVEASPIYSKILAQQPRDYDVNFRYGTCLLYNSHHKEEAIRYLSYAVKGPDIDKRAFYYLGRAYHLNYQFNEAIIQYEKFKSVGNPAQVKTLEVDQQILACKNGKKLLSNVTDMVVIQKTEIKAEDFYEIYKLNNIGGTILVTDSDEFLSKLDRQKGHKAIIHFPAKSPAIYYSSYGTDGETGLDIYVKRKLPDGKYGEAQKVQGGVNTSFDEDYAYMHPNGKYLYFCSKGHNSMGGYDVFRSAYNASTNAFGPAENMDFAVSSPDDDIFFVVDSLDRNAYFASSRESQNGKLFVYEVRVDRIPLQIAVIKGSFVNSINVSNKVVSIQVVDFSTGETVGTFSSKESNGEYLITFPKPGKYQYIIEIKGSEYSHKVNIEIPYQKEFTPLKQRITVTRDDMGDEQVKVENLFDEQFDDPIAVMAEIYKTMSTLIPNSTKYNLDSLDKINAGNEVFTEAGLDEFTTKADVEKAVDDEIKDLNNSIAQDEKNAAIAYHLAEEKSDSANALMVEINKNIQLAENTTDPNEKNRILTDVSNDTRVVERLNEDSKNLVVLGNAIDESIAEKKNDLVEANAVKDDLKTVPEGDKTALGTMVTENKNFFVENVKNNAPHENVVDEIVQTNTSQANETQKLNSDLATLRKEKLDLEAKNVNLQQQADATKNKKEKEVFQQQILANENRVEELQMQILEKEKQYDAAINSGGNSTLGNAAQIVENPKNATPDNVKTLTATEKDAIDTKVQANNLDANIASVNKVLDENNIGGPAINLFASDATTKNYTLQQWTDAIDNELERLEIKKMSASGEERVKIEQEIQRYEELRETKIQEFDRVVDPTKILPEINPNDVVTGYETRKEGINRIPDEGDRRAENLKLNEELKQELLAEKNNLQRVLDENPGNKNIEERIANIDKLILATDTQITEDKKWIAQNSGTVVVDTEQVVATVDPGYQARINEIYKTTDPTQRNAEIKILNTSFAEKSSERLQELEATLKSNPNDAVAKAELAELKRLNDQIATDATQPLVKPVVFDIATVDPKVTPDQVLKNYNARKTDIAKITDPYDRKVAENVLNKELSTAIGQEIKKLENLLADNPGNADITERIANLKKLDDQTNSSIVANEQWLAQNPKSTAVVVDGSDVKLINPNYQAKVDSIKQIQDPNQQKTAIQDLNNQTVAKIDERTAELNKVLAQNPGDQAALNEKAELTEMKTQIQGNPDKTLTQPTDYSSINTKPTVGEIMPDYQDKMNAINGSTQSQVDKEKDKIELNQDLISIIDSEIASLTNAKTTNPEAAKNIDKRIAGLNTIKTQKQNEIAVSTNAINSVPTNTTAITVKDVMPDYDSKVAAIDKKNLAEKSELTEKNAVNTELIGKIDTKISALEAEKAKDPSNIANINRDIQTLNDIKTQKQGEITQNNARIQELDSGTSSSRPALTINSVMPEYEKKMADIDKKSTGEKSKLLEKNTLNTQLITSLDKKIADLEKEKVANPADAAAIDKDIQTLQNIKAQKQNEIEVNKQRITDLDNGITSRPVMTISTIMPGYEPGIAAIDQKNADEQTKLTEKNALTNQLIVAVDTKIADLEKEKIANPANAAVIENDIQTLQNIKAQKQNEITANNQRINELQGGTSSSRPAITLNSIMPGYETNMAAIDQNTTSSEKTKLTQKNTLNNQLIVAIDKKIADLEKEKLANPSNAAAIDKDMQTLQNIKSQKQNEINLNKQRITDLDNGIATRPAMTISSIMPGYEPGIAAIDQKSADEKTKLAEKNTLNNQLIVAIDKKIADLEKEKLANPSNAAAIDKDIQTLQNIKAQKQNEINVNTQRIAELENGTASTRPAITISSIMPGYEPGIAAIDQKSADEKTKLAEKNALTNQLIVAIDKKIADLEKEKIANPSNAVAIDKDIQTLQNIKAQKQNEININTQRIADLENGTASTRPAITISSIMPGYEPGIAAIDQKSADEKTKLAEKNALTNQLIVAIDKKIADLEKEKIANPSNAAAIDKDIQTLQNIKAQKQNEINVNTQRIQSLEGTAASRPVLTISSIIPDYDAKMAAIDKKNLDEKSELTEKNAVNNQLIAAIDSKIAQLETEKTNNPANTAAIDKDIQTLQNIKAQKQSEINLNKERIAQIDSGDTTSRPVLTINSIMPDYDKKMAAIEKKNLDEKSELTEKNAVNNQLIAAIDTKLASLETEKTNNPADAAAIDKDIQNLNNLKSQKQAEINLNNERISQLNTGSSQTGLTANDLLPGYDQKIAAIDQSTSKSEKTKLLEKNTLNTQLISAIDKKIADLEKEKTNNPANSAAIDKDIQTLNNLKAQKQGEINANNLRISEIDNGVSSSRPAITINSLMPEYEPGIARIDGSTQSEQIKLQEKNKLNQQLIGAIDSKIASLNTELKSNPANAAAIQQDINKLLELKESKRAEIDKNNSLLSSMGVSTDVSVKSITETNPNDFSSAEGKNALESHSDDIAEIKALDTDISNLENQLANTTNPGEQAKIEKQIEKKEYTQARLENEVLEDLGTANQAEYKNMRDGIVVNGTIATAGNPTDASVIEANNAVKEADALIQEAQQLRNEAANEKDPLLANQKLEKAFENEQRADALLQEANLTYKTAEVVDQLGGNDPVIVTSVSSNPSDRQSTDLYNQAAQLEAKADQLNAQAAHLMDSSLTVKKKYREGIVLESKQLDSLAAVYRTEANELKTQAAAIKSQEDAIAEVLPQSNNKAVDSETVNDVIATSDYKNYYDAKTIGDSNMFRAEELGNDIAALQERKERKIREGIVTYGTGPELEKALANDAEFKDIQHDLDSLKKLQEQYRDRGIASYQQAENVLEKTDAEMRDNVLAISDRDLSPVEKIVVNVNPIAADFNAPDQLNASIFRTTTAPVYSAAKPIPVDQQQPSGLVYKVQVGAFRQPLPAEYFNKFAPISGQKIGDGITRYMVGYFTNFTVADNSKEQVHDLGYGDAFVVAYCNGQRISLAEAKEIEAGKRECPGTNLIAVNNMTVNQTTSAVQTTTQGGNTTTQGGNTVAQITPKTDQEKQLTSYYSSVPDAAKANQVEIIKGLFFTVQIGVYSKPVKASLLYNIQPLNSQLTEDNKIRYTTGIYCNIDDASKRKNEIVTVGITDAFVTAYYNGKRITIAEANALLAQNGPSVLFDCAGLGNQVATTQTTNQGGNQTTNQGGNQTTNQGGNQTTNQGGNQTTNQGGNQTTNQGGNQTTNQGGNQTTNQGGNQTTNLGGGPLVYDPSDTTGLWRVRVGYFENEVPADFIELLLNNQNEGIVSESDGDENMTFYTIPFTDRESAEDRADALKAKGFKQAGVQKMPSNVDELGNKINVPVETAEKYYKEGIYYRIMIGKYANEIPGEYATILLQTENILETEVDADGNTYILSTKIEDMGTVRERLVELYELGIEDMEIITYYKYDPIPFEQGEQIMQEKPITKLDYYNSPQGISADSYLYNKDAIYFRVDVGKFAKDVPQEFANLLFENPDENILREETFEGETFFYTENIKSYQEAEAIYKRLLQKGFKDAKLVAFHKYDELSVEKARKILSGQ